MSRTVKLKEYEEFKAECMRLKKELGLTDWKIYFSFEKDDNLMAWTYADSDTSRATITLNRQWPKNTDGDIDMKRTALHEMLHVVTAELFDLAFNRFASKEDLNKTEESLVTRLENLLYGRF